MALNLRTLSAIVGILFIAVGIAGFMPMFMKDGLLLGLFSVDQMHNNIHLVSGVIFLLAAIIGKFAKILFIIFGLIYLAVAILGFMGRTDLLMMMSLNNADNILHLVLGILFLYFGFIFKRA